MKISKETLKGYILEEVLAYLIRKTGYKLLVDPEQDPRELGKRGNGLVVKGRGGSHQVDVLGQLNWIPAFTFPLRLFIEAKFRKRKTGIEAVRNAVGVLLDISQNNSPTREQKVFHQKYHYAYALFATSGFSKYAVDMALAHEISLIDLSGDEFRELRDVIDQAAGRIINSRDFQIDNSGEEFETIDAANQGKFVCCLRNTLRCELGTWPSEIEHPECDMPTLLTVLEFVINKAQKYGELLVAMANGPFMLILKADNLDAFLHYSRRHPRHKVSIRWSRQVDEGRTWEIYPADTIESYRLSFRLPETLANWIFGISKGVRERALQVKQTFFSDITIYRYIERQDYLVRLEFDLESTRRHTVSIDLG